MAYEVETKKGKYYLHRKNSLFYFSPRITKEDAIDDIPEGYEVGKNPRTGMPFIRRIK